MNRLCKVFFGPKHTSGFPKASLSGKRIHTTIDGAKSTVWLASGKTLFGKGISWE
jgi:hypothetical protein